MTRTVFAAIAGLEAIGRPISGAQGMPCGLRGLTAAQMAQTASFVDEVKPERFSFIAKGLRASILSDVSGFLE